MNKWRFWKDEVGKDRHEISCPEFDGVEISEDAVEGKLRSFFALDMGHFIEMYEDANAIEASVTCCLDCGKSLIECLCENVGMRCTCISFHATRI